MFRKKPDPWYTHPDFDRLNRSLLIEVPETTRDLRTFVVHTTDNLVPRTIKATEMEQRGGFTLFNVVKTTGWYVSFSHWSGLQKTEQVNYQTVLRIRTKHIVTIEEVVDAER